MQFGRLIYRASQTNYTVSIERMQPLTEKFEMSSGYIPIKMLISQAIILDLKLSSGIVLMHVSN